MISSIIQEHFKIKIQPNVRDQEKKRQSINDLHNAVTKPKIFRNKWRYFVYRIQNKEIIFLQKKSSLRKRVSRRLKKKRKEGFLTALAMVIKKDHT